MPQGYARISEEDRRIAIQKQLAKKRRGARDRSAGKSGPSMRVLNMRPHVENLSTEIPKEYSFLHSENPLESVFFASLIRINERGLRPSELLKLLETNIESSRVIRVQTHFTTELSNSLPSNNISMKTPSLTKISPVENTSGIINTVPQNTQTEVNQNR